MHVHRLCPLATPMRCPDELYMSAAPGYTGLGRMTRANFWEDQGMRLQRQWWSRLVAAVLLGLVGVTTVAAAGEQFLPILSVREGALRFIQIPRADGIIAYLTLLNARDGGINGVPLVWEECETDCGRRPRRGMLRAPESQGVTGAAVVFLLGTPLADALISGPRTTRIPLLTPGFGRTDAMDGRVFPDVFHPPTNYWSQNTAKIRFIGQQAGGMDQLKGRKIAHVYHDSAFGRETIPMPWGFEHIALTAAALKELGAEGLFPPITLSCRDHEGGGSVQFQQWDGHAVDGHHRLDGAGSGAGKAPGGGVGGEVCAGEGDHATGLPVGAGCP